MADNVEEMASCKSYAHVVSKQTKGDRWIKRKNKEY